MKWIAFLICSAGSAFAQAEDCINIEVDLDRLACYDLATGRTPTQNSIANESEWDVDIETSAMTDQSNVFMTVTSKEEISCGSLYDKAPALLMVRCRENTTSVIYSASCHLTSSGYDNYGDITYRLDDNPALTKSFKEATNNKALGLWSGGKAIPFTKAMFDHDQILMRVTPYGESPHTATFNIAGLSDVIGPLREACHW